jgi:hypothetical protein
LLHLIFKGHYSSRYCHVTNKFGAYVVISEEVRQD